MGKSGKQRRAELTARKQARIAQGEANATADHERRLAAELAAKVREGVAVDHDKLAPYNSYGPPEFITRGYYVDVEFTCRDCGVVETWAAAQQKWWYEVAQGPIYSTAVRCRACRQQHQAATGR